jgi:uncharacterized membrane protein
MQQNRFQSKVLWTAIIGQIISLAQLTGVFTQVGLDAGMVGDFAAGVLQILVLVGVLNNPTDSVNW